MLRALLERWRRWRLSCREKRAQKGRREDDASVPFAELQRRFDERFERASRRIDAIEAAVRPLRPSRGRGRFQRLWARAQRRIQRMVDDASRLHPRHRRNRPHPEAVAEMERRLDAFKACIAEFEAERDRAADLAVAWHRNVLLAERLGEPSLVRDALQCRHEHEKTYASCAREARKLRAISDEIERAATTLASLGKN